MRGAATERIFNFCGGTAVSVSGSTVE